MENTIQVNITFEEYDLIMKHREKVAKIKEREAKLAEAKELIEKGLHMFIDNGGSLELFNDYCDNEIIDNDWEFCWKENILNSRLIFHRE